MDLLKIYQIGSRRASPVPDATLDSQLMEGITHLEHLAQWVSLDSGPMEGMLCLEPSEQSVLNSSLVTRPSKLAMGRKIGVEACDKSGY